MTTAVPTRAQSSLVPTRLYQRECLDAIHEARSRGVTRQLVSMATGGGKTIVAGHLVNEADLPKVVFLVHRDELVRQSVDSLSRINPNLSIGVCKAERDDIYAQVVVASAATLAKGARLERLRRATEGLGGLLLVSDEAHHDLAPSRRRAIEVLRPDLLVGLTATPNRSDKVGLDGIYEEVVFHLGLIPLIAMGKLAPLKGLRIDTETELDGVHTRAGELAEDELAVAVDTLGRNRLIVESWKRHAADRKRTVAFCVNVRHAEHLAEAFHAAGIPAQCVFGHTPPAERQDILARFHRGDIPVLINVMVLSEGYDEPGIDTILWARPTKSQGLYIQCIGRGARMSEATGKRDCLVIDFVDSSSKHKLISLPMLAGERDELDPKKSSSSEPKQKNGELVDLLELAQRQDKVREKAAVAVDLFGSSPYLWRSVGQWHMAPAGKNRYLVLLEQGDGYVPHELIDDREIGAAHLKPLFDRSLDVETAMGVAESRMVKDPLTTRAAQWRDGLPTPKQLEIARKFRLDVPEHATKGDLSGLIDTEFFKRAIKRASASAGLARATHQEG